MVNNPLGHQLILTSFALGVINIIALALRILARWRSKAAFAADDALIIASIAPISGNVVISYLCVEAGGLGLSTAVNLELGHGPSRISLFLKLLMSGVVTYTLAITLVKLSILALYRRIFSTLVFEKTTRIVRAVVILWFIIAVFTYIFQCRPFQAAFDPDLLFTEHCINLEAYFRGITASNLGIDAAILYMPLYIVWGLKLRTRQKVALSGIFLLGGIACIAGAWRLATLGSLRKDNWTYTVTKACIWSQIEISIAMLCACLMTLRPLFADLNLILSKLSNRFFSRSKSSSLSHNTSSTELIRGSVSHPQWSDIQESGLKDSTRSRSEGTDTKSGLRIITVGLGATKGKEPLMQV